MLAPHLDALTARAVVLHAPRLEALLSAPTHSMVVRVRVAILALRDLCFDGRDEASRVLSRSRSRLPVTRGQSQSGRGGQECCTS